MQNKIRVVQAAALFLLLIVFTAGSARTVCAAAPTASATIRVEQSFTVNDSRWDPEGVFSYIMEAETVSAPMPEKTGQDGYRFTIEGNGQADIGPLVFTRPGQYRYTLRQEISEEKEGYTYDEEVYSIVVTVRNTTGGGLTATVELPCNRQGYKEEKVLFENTYAKEVPVSPTPTPDGQETSEASSPKTGDQSQTRLFINMMAFSVISMIWILAAAKKQRKARGEV